MHRSASESHLHAGWPRVPMVSSAEALTAPTRQVLNHIDRGAAEDNASLAGPARASTPSHLDFLATCTMESPSVTELPAQDSHLIPQPDQPPEPRAPRSCDGSCRGSDTVNSSACCSDGQTDPRSRSSPPSQSSMSYTPDCNPESSWAYLSDTEMLQMAERVLHGVVSPDLLRKLGRRQTVDLLVAHLSQKHSRGSSTSICAAGSGKALDSSVSTTETAYVQTPGRAPEADDLPSSWWYATEDTLEAVRAMPTVTCLNHI